MSDQADLINGKRSANREQQTLPGGLRTPAEKDVLFCEDQVASDAVSGETQERCCWWCWVKNPRNVVVISGWKRRRREP